MSERGDQPARTLPELLAPAGDWECAKAAVENGADAIYFGLERFNARMRAHNFTEADLPRLIEFLHKRGVKGYVTFNTLVFADELNAAEEMLRGIITAGVDAVIVQDVGICRLIRQLSPDFPIHASTQMTITSAAGVEFARELGCQLVVLARECSIKEIEMIRSILSNSASQVSSRAPGLPLEVFVHGALCVAYSGQCLTSEALGGRSANRGECAQACRMPYELISDGKLVPLGDRRYLLSPQDLAGLDVIPNLSRAGVSSFKIEGRLKTPEYVANITRLYREALDRCANHSAEPIQTSTSASSETDSRYLMEMAFSRGLSTGWLRGIDNQALVHARFGKKRGVYLGEVSRVQGGRVYLRLEGPLKPGDGVVFDSGHPEVKEEGGRVYTLERADRDGAAEAFLTFGRGDVELSRVRAGDKVWKTSDPELDRRLRQSFAGEEPKFRQPLSLQIQGSAGEPAVILARDEVGHVVEVHSRTPLAVAHTRPLTTDRLRDQLGRLGGTPFRLGTLTNQLDGSLILPVSELNRLRREFTERLNALRSQPKRWRLITDPILTPAWSDSSVPPEQPFPSSPTLIVLVRNLAQLEAALAGGVQTLYCDFEDPKKYREAVRLFRDKLGSPSPLAPRRGIFVAPPRIFKMGEDWTLKQVRASDADGYLVRNYDHLRFFADCRCVGDYSLNVANPLSAEYFIQRFGLEHVTASYDLNIAQLAALLRAAPPRWFEITIHQHMPMFHMEHCVFCAFLSTGTDYTNCGRPCDKHEVKLRDRVGMEHPLKADVGCRNTIFNARAQTGAEYVPQMLALGASRFRLEFLTETPSEVSRFINRYRELLAGRISGAQVWQEFKLINQLGVTRGQMAGDSVQR